jgi:hypothetical protein
MTSKVQKSAKTRKEDFIPELWRRRRAMGRKKGQICEEVSEGSIMGLDVN